MRYLFLTILAVAITGCAGCKTTSKMPLQPGESVWFESKERADEFRAASGQNQDHTSRVVVIDQPTQLVFD